MKIYALIEDGKTIDTGGFVSMHMKALREGASEVNVYEVRSQATIQGQASVWIQTPSNHYFRIERVLKSGEKQSENFYDFALDAALHAALEFFAINLEVKEVAQ